jgi:hypothetical protein
VILENRECYVKRILREKFEAQHSYAMTQREPPTLPNLLKRKWSEEIVWGSTGKDARYLNKLRRLLGKTEESDRKLLLYMAQKMANR